MVLNLADLKSNQINKVTDFLFLNTPTLAPMSKLSVTGLFAFQKKVSANAHWGYSI